jgi:TPP-dependent pyruvate/acetoin dehydrogenase alpha subunit
MQARLYRALYRIRRFEEEAARAYPSDVIKSPVHLSIGQEAVSVGVCEALAPGDIVYGTYRGHALYLARGGDMAAMAAELYGKASGCAGGRGGSMHLIDPDKGVMGMSAVVGTTIANAVGHAYALKHRREGRIVASFFGDGATEEGVFSESLNFAVLKKLPVLFVCENNGYAIHTPQSRRQGSCDIAARARAFGMPAWSLGSSDVEALTRAVRPIVESIRAGHGPAFLEVATYRWREHVGPGTDFHLGYRTEDEAEPHYREDAVAGLASQLHPSERQAIEAEADREVADAFAFAEASPFPDPATLLTHTFEEQAA